MEPAVLETNEKLLFFKRFYNINIKSDWVRGTSLNNGKSTVLEKLLILHSTPIVKFLVDVRSNNSELAE